MQNSYIQEREVQTGEIDQNNHVNNVVYLEWVQDIAYKHWNELTKDNPLDNFVWFVIRHEIDYIQQVVLGDKITLKTWVGETQGVKSVRHVEILKDGTLLAKSVTTFCLLNTATKRPARISKEIKDILQIS